MCYASFFTSRYFKIKMSSGHLKLKINGATTMDIELPVDILETIQEDSSVLVNLAQNYTEEEIQTIEIVDDITFGNKEVDDKRIWSDANIKLLIDLYQKNAEVFETGIKKHAWSRISQIIAEKVNTPVSGVQCDTKWKGLQKHYKTIKRHNETSGNEPKYWKFYTLMDSILHKKPEINPVATCSSTGLKVNQNDDQLMSDTSSTSSRASTPSISHTNKKRKLIDNAIERRHKEKLERQDRSLDI